MLNYFSSVQCGDMTCSIDRIRIDFRFCYSKDFDVVADFMNWLSHCDTTGLFHFETWTSRQVYKVRNLFTFNLPNKSTIKLGIGYNGEKERMRCGFLEFNPNKVLYDECGGFRSVNDNNVYLCSIEIVEKLFRRLYDDCECWIIRDFDIAIDLPYSRDKFFLRKDTRDYRLFKVSDLNYTEYLGKRGNAGAIKLYNKAIESKLYYPLTRLEITSEIMDYETFLKKAPDCFLQDDFDAGDLRDTDLVLCQLFSRLEPAEKDLYFRRLGRGKQQKLKPYIFGRADRKIVIPRDAYYELLKVVMQFHSPHYVDDTTKSVYSAIDEVLRSEETSGPSTNGEEPKEVEYKQSSIDEFLSTQTDLVNLSYH